MNWIFQVGGQIVLILSLIFTGSSVVVTSSSPTYQIAPVSEVAPVTTQVTVVPKTTQDEQIPATIINTNLPTTTLITIPPIVVNIPRPEPPQVIVIPKIVFVPKVVQAPVVEPVIGTSIIDCTPALEASVVAQAGTIDTGIDYMFIGTTTLPTGCSLDENMIIKLQGPNLNYTGPLWGWKNSSGAIKNIANGFVFRQGWGVGAHNDATGISLTWAVGSTTKSITVQ